MKDSSDSHQLEDDHFEGGCGKEADSIRTMSS